MNAQVAELRQRIDQAAAFTSQIAGYIEGAQLGLTERDRIARLLWQQVVEDGLAVPVLIERRYTGSARALLRPQIEALARGAWARLLASDPQLQQFANDQAQPPGIAALVRDLSAHPWTIQNEPVALDVLWQRGRNAFHDSAHRGTRAVARLAIANHGDLNHVGEDEVAILYLAAVCAGIAGTALLEDAGPVELAAQAWGRAREFFDAWDR